jgi:glycosyltransferase involved in cell wall biosynthesis
LNARVRQALLRAQRLHWRPPAPVTRLARRVLRDSLEDADVVEPWTRPLVGEARLAAPPPAADAAEAPDAADGPPAGSPHAGGAPLHCALVIDTLDVGGAEQVVALLARRLPAFGISTSVLFTTAATGNGHPPRVAAALVEAGVEVVQVDEAGAGAHLAARRPDVISAHEPPAWWIDLAAQLGIPYLETLHGMHAFFDADWLPEDEHRRKLAAEAERSRKAAAIIAVSELVREQYLAVNPQIEPARVVTVPNSVESARVPRLDPARCRDWLGLRDEFLFVSLARHSPQKNPYGLISAFDEVAAEHPRAHLLIAGRPDAGNYPHQVRQLRDGLRSRDRIHLRDHAPWPAAPLAAANAFVLDSYFEGWSLASMEALYAGLPVVLSDVGGAREQVGEDGERGHLIGNPLGDRLAVDWKTINASLYVPQPNRDELVAAMCRTIERRERWAARRDELRRESAGRFHPDRAVRGHAAVIRRAAENA